MAQITATVEHNGTHQVRVDMPTWNEHQLQYAQRVATGGSDDLSDAVHTALVHNGQTPGPEQGSITATCSCRSRKRPCAHILAVFFDIARHLDHRPRLALVLRGMNDAHPTTTTARIPIGLLDPAHFYE
ncbi:putative Zn finger protein [Actinopolyspora biskrensis]|uniref:Putative Zn finger protein n=1 Tax=Actinopolyspora biskrensis TaxID=1470178 RepID=A0A852YTD4_9ACTN|nr:putative Zn finger protein [Actinopolyspora biskrensis]